jgi:hypothetical protein
VRPERPLLLLKLRVVALQREEPHWQLLLELRVGALQRKEQQWQLLREELKGEEPERSLLLLGEEQHQRLRQVQQVELKGLQGTFTKNSFTIMHLILVFKCLYKAIFKNQL